MVLWRIYITGRFGFERELGLVWANSDLCWIRLDSYVACDALAYITDTGIEVNRLPWRKWGLDNTILT